MPNLSNPDPNRLAPKMKSLAMLKRKNLTALAAPLLLALVLAASLERASAETGPPLVGAFEGNFRLLDQPVPAPTESVETADGGQARTGDFAGQVVLLNFWATWCAPCVREMPSLDRLQAALGGQGLVVMAVSEDRTFAQIEDFYAEQRLLNLDAYLDKRGALARAFEVRGMPTTVVIDRDGLVVGSMQGPAEWDSEEAKALLRWYLEREEQPIKTSG